MSERVYGVPELAVYTKAALTFFRILPGRVPSRYSGGS
jgi:hypothetical protein